MPDDPAGAAPGAPRRKRKANATTPAPVATLPTGDALQALRSAYISWQVSQQAKGRLWCDHARPMTETCLPCFDGRVWEQAAAAEPAEPYAMPLPAPAAAPTIDMDALAQRLRDDVYAVCRREFVSAARLAEVQAEISAEIARITGPLGEADIAALVADDIAATYTPSRVVAPPFHLRCSSLPRFRECPASCDLSPEQIRIESDSEPALLGTAVHALGRMVIEHGDGAARADLDAAAEQHDVDRGDLRYLLSQLIEAWRVLAPLFPGAVAEDEIACVVDGLRLTGHPDVYAGVGATLRVLDWKSGRAVYDAREQLLGYALTLLEHQDPLGQYEHAELYTCWLREGKIPPPVRLRVADVLAWGDDLARRATARPLPYSPGDHCAECPRRADCPAKAAWLRQAVAEFGGASGDPAEAMRHAKALAKLADDAIGAIRQHVIDNGEIQAGEGRVLRVSSVDASRVRLARAAVLGDVRDALAEETVVPWGKVRAALKGKSAADVEAIKAALVEAGAFVPGETRRVEEGCA